MKIRFGELYPTNRIKNTWNSKYYRQKFQRDQWKQKRNRTVRESDNSVKVTTPSHQFPVNEGFRNFTQSLLNGAGNIDVTLPPIVPEPKFFQPHAPQLLPNSSEFGISVNNSFTYLPKRNPSKPTGIPTTIQPNFQPCLPTIVLRPIF
jgi:hypothetical protein